MAVLTAPVALDSVPADVCWLIPVAWVVGCWPPIWPWLAWAAPWTMPLAALLTGRDADWAVWLVLAAVLAAEPAALDTAPVVATAAVDVVALDAGALDAEAAGEAGVRETAAGAVLVGAGWDVGADPLEDPWGADLLEEATADSAEEATEEAAEGTGGPAWPAAWGTASAGDDPAVPGEDPPVSVPGSAAADAGRAKMTARTRTKMNAPARPLHVYRHRRSAAARILGRPTLGGRA